MDEHVEVPGAGTYEALGLVAAVRSERLDWDGRTVFHFRIGPKMYTVTVRVDEIPDEEE